MTPASSRPLGRTPWLPRGPSAAASGRVFCLPYAGCGASLFRNWPRERDGVEFLPVELPGRETRLREPVPGTFEELAGALIDGIRGYLDVPFGVFGHCWSALAGYEVAVQLQRAGPPVPRRLYVSSSTPPHSGIPSRLHGVDGAQLADEISGTIRALGGQPHPGLVELYVDVLRADVAVGGRYAVGTPVRLRCPITAIGWSEDTEVEPGQMAGWQDCGDTTFAVLPGRHHRFVDAPAPLLGLLCSGLG